MGPQLEVRKSLPPHCHSDTQSLIAGSCPGFTGEYKQTRNSDTGNPRHLRVRISRVRPAPWQQRRDAIGPRAVFRSV